MTAVQRYASSTRSTAWVHVQRPMPAFACAAVLGGMMLTDRHGPRTPVRWMSKRPFNSISSAATSCRGSGSEVHRSCAGKSVKVSFQQSLPFSSKTRPTATSLRRQYAAGAAMAVEGSADACQHSARSLVDEVRRHGESERIGAGLEPYASPRRSPTGCGTKFRRPRMPCWSLRNPRAVGASDARTPWAMNLRRL